VDDRPRPHAAPLRHEVDGNAAQRQSDAPGADSSSVVTDRAGQGSDRENSRGSTANGVPEFDEDAGEQRRKQYDEGAGLVSGLD
jgi:hypothetical protein